MYLLGNEVSLNAAAAEWDLVATLEPGNHNFYCFQFRPTNVTFLLSHFWHKIWQYILSMCCCFSLFIIFGIN